VLSQSEVRDFIERIFNAFDEIRQRQTACTIFPAVSAHLRRRHVVFLHCERETALPYRRKVRARLNGWLRFNFDRIPRATSPLPLLGIRQNDANRRNPHRANSMWMRDRVMIAVVSLAYADCSQSGLQLNCVSRRNMLTATAAYPWRDGSSGTGRRSNVSRPGYKPQSSQPNHPGERPLQSKDPFDERQ
jgi:hypothetical protein